MYVHVLYIISCDYYRVQLLRDLYVYMHALWYNYMYAQYTEWLRTV